MKLQKTLIILSVLSILFSCAGPETNIVLKNGKIYTMEENQAWASAIAITGNKITAVLVDDKDVDKYIGPNTKVIDLGGKFVTPGFIDSHTHMAGFGAQQNDIDLMTVADNAGLMKELKRVVDILGDDEWITGGRWEGHKIWEADWREREQLKVNRWEPDRWIIDDISKNNPCLLSSYDGDLYLANTAALKASGLENAKLEGMKLDRQGRPTGLIYKDSPALQKIREVRKPKSEERILNELRAALRLMAERGITEVHDISSERLMKRYAYLQDRGELIIRVWGRPGIQNGQNFMERGIKMNTHPVTGKRDYYLRWGAYKGFYDGFLGSHTALLFEPYADKPETTGAYRNDTSDDPQQKIKNPDKFYNFMKIAFADGFAVHTHAIGSRGVAEFLDDCERLVNETGVDLNRSRVIHAEIVRPSDFDRFVKMGLIAETNPSQMADDMRWIKDRLGPEREKRVFPFKQFVDEGIVMTFGSDVPSNAGATFSNHPALAINAAVHRTNPDGVPEGGWGPDQKISVHEALKAFTINGAYAVYDEDIRGSIKVGKLADIAVCTVNIIENPDKILDMDIEMTIVDGKVVFER